MRSRLLVSKRTRGRRNRVNDGPISWERVRISVVHERCVLFLVRKGMKKDETRKRVPKEFSDVFLARFEWHVFHDHLRRALPTSFVLAFARFLHTSAS